MKKYFYAFLWLALLFLSLCVLNSCEEEKEGLKACGCNSHDATPINDDHAIVFIHENKPILLSLEAGYLVMCDSTKTFKDGTILTNVSGSLRSSCKTVIDTAYAFHEHYKYEGRYFNLQGSKRYVLPLLEEKIVWKQFTLEIFKSEDYGYPPGFGFRIVNTETGFKLFEPTLPVAGWVPCKTSVDAAKVGFLYITKMYQQSAGLVDVYEKELNFLGVYEF
jgi:hypothetical protein